MDKLWRRLKFFAIGLGFGCILVYFTFGNRGCSWLPGNRVKNMIGEKEIIIGDSVLALMKCNELNNDDIYELLKTNGDVEFSLSETRTKPKIYYIEGEKDGATYYAKFALYEQEPLSMEGDEYAEVVAVNWTEERSCTTPLSNQHKSTLPLPHADVIAILEEHEFKFLEEAECNLTFYGLTEEAILTFHLTAEIDIESSAPRENPNPYYVMTGLIDGKSYQVLYIIGENRTRIAEISGNNPSDCK